MTEKKDINIDWKNIWRKIEKYTKWILKKMKVFWIVLKKWKVVKVLGAVLVFVMAIWIFIETIILGLVHSNPAKFEEIFNYFFGVNFFEYVSKKDFYWITGGGYLIDLALYLSLLFLGVFLWRKKNYFKKKALRIVLVVTLGLGIILLSNGIYRAMPHVMVPLQKIQQACNQKEKGEHYEENNWRVQRNELRNGFEERGYLDEDNVKAFYYNVFNKNY